MLESKGIAAHRIYRDREGNFFFFFLQRKRQNALLSKKRTYFVKWDMILFSELALGWKLKFMWSFLHLYSLAIILYNQKVLQPKGPSVLNYDIWKEPTGHPSLTKSERLHANTQTHAHTDTHTHTASNTVSFSYRVIQMMVLDYLDEALN